MNKEKSSDPVSVFHLFSVGIGPSSSHTLGPMRAARLFALLLQESQNFTKVAQVIVDLYGSLALTGKGHSTDLAILLGLEGAIPDKLDPEKIPAIIGEIREKKCLKLMNLKEIPFEESKHLLFHRDKQLPFHPNAMRFTAFDKNDVELASKVYYSVGGGFIVDHETTKNEGNDEKNAIVLPHPFSTGQELLDQCNKNHCTIAQLMLENEKVWLPEPVIREKLLEIWHIMKKCVERGCQKEGILPGGLGVKRRAAGIFQNLQTRDPGRPKTMSEVMEWVSLWALAVNEENAAGGRLVTAPTNGAAGVIPSVMHYVEKTEENSSEEGMITFLLTAGAMGILFKKGASISAAEMGCMGEVGVACAMAAAGLTATLGGTNEQIENAAEIGMEHNLGLTCDPIQGLVQIPCIERNAMGAVKAITAALLAMHGDGTHRVSLDQVIATMRQTGIDMKSIYKETSLGGLAVNVPEC